MSNLPPKTRKTRRRNTRPAAASFTGLPTWSGVGIIFAALVTGLLVSVAMGGLGVTYLLCFTVAGIAVALFVELRGLFLSVAVLPLLFGILTPVAAWFVAQTMATAATGFSTTAIVTAIYPLAQFFPVLIVITVGAAVIALLRLWLHQRREQEREVVAREVRRREADADRANRATAYRARQTSTRTPRRSRTERGEDRVTVEELLRRNQPRENRSIRDDLYES
ncbi:hypothetical protein COCCU_04730 [Corynebacterium occultum]|uniref:DUF6542 domain-containing protein n=1 Tax=Corynebacterium occultum TaxID=2675219 RepID=A0A6B8VN11_9CORY|nr:DUF6542 domain-containing protein [Corynebacterium occultum]QGU06892.1 hypothetical protein COCCU_04730 [Corynebacterium occultum]